MIRFYFHPTPNPAKIALFLEEAGLPYQVVPVDTSEGEQHASFSRCQPEWQGAGDRRYRRTRVALKRGFSIRTAILIYLAEKAGKFVGKPQDRPSFLSSLFIASGLVHFPAGAGHFQFAGEGLDYAVVSRREAERHYQVLNDHLKAGSSWATSPSSSFPPEVLAPGASPPGAV